MLTLVKVISFILHLLGRTKSQKMEHYLTASLTLLLSTIKKNIETLAKESIIANNTFPASTICNLFEAKSWVLTKRLFAPFTQMFTLPYLPAKEGAPTIPDGTPPFAFKALFASLASALEHSRIRKH